MIAAVTRYRVIGGEYQDAAFAKLIPGTETMAGSFADETRARTEWTCLTCCPNRGAAATVRLAIVAERLH